MKKFFCKRIPSSLHLCSLPNFCGVLTATSPLMREEPIMFLQMEGDFQRDKADLTLKFEINDNLLGLYGFISLNRIN